MTSIGSDAFTGDPISSLTLPGTVIYVGADSFEGCLLTNLTIAEGVGAIGGYAFLGNPLTSIMLPGPPSLAPWSFSSDVAPSCAPLWGAR